jgi:hypothetical protein
VNVLTDWMRTAKSGAEVYQEYGTKSAQWSGQWIKEKNVHVEPS